MLLDVRGVSKQFDGRCAVDEVTFSLEPGERLAVLGPSGCGKSTLLRLIQGLIRPDHGDVLFRGRSIGSFSPASMRKYRRQVGMVFQHVDLIPHMNVYGNVALALRAAGLPDRIVHERVKHALSRVGMAQAAERKPPHLSGGEKQRAAIARVIALDPAVILWDEPTSALDPLLAQEVVQVMADLARSKDTAMVWVTHDIPLIVNQADKVLLMDEGRVVEEGSVEQILHAPRSRIGQLFAHAHATAGKMVLKTKVMGLKGRKLTGFSRRDQHRTGQPIKLYGRKRKVVPR